METDMVFVYDRTMKDVEYVMELTKKYQDGTITEDEKRIWADGMKGALNAGDLNRIESNISAIAAILQAEIEECRTDWSVHDRPHAKDYDRIRSNTQSIKNALAYTPGVAAVPDRPLNTYEKWNEIEKILYDVNELHTRIINSLYRCGDELYAGEGVGWL